MTGAAVAVLTAAVGVAPAQSQTSSDDQLGRSPATAAVSCWDIKQRDPAATDGTYWLLTPTMPAPEAFHCDMTTDGGGWVLVGRGREGWRFSYNGQGTPAQVRSAVDGPDAFLTRTLAAPVVDGLLGGGRPDALPDGVRLARAAGVDGAVRQDVRIHLTQRDRWAWSFDADHPVGWYRMGSTTAYGGVTRDFGRNQWYLRVRTQEMQSHGWTAGWGYGSSVVGTNSPSSYLWSSNGEGNALPFTQVYIRPMLTAGDTTFPALPDEGLPAQAQRPLLANQSIPQSWGVTGSANGRTGELNTEVQAFAQSGNRVIVGGNFSHVQRGANATGSSKVAQPYLAAFDVRTGDWISDFRPVLDGQVKDLQTLPDGRLVAVGEFDQVNGQPAVGLVALDPVTGATDHSFEVALENRLSGQSVAVQALDVQGPWLYVAGRFTHLAGGSRTTPVYARMATRVSVTDGTPDAYWNPAFNGTVIDIDASDRGDRVYAAGHFTWTKGVETGQVAVVSTAAGADLIPGLHPPAYSNEEYGRYQQAILEVGDRVWQGGAEHMLFSYDRDDFSLLSGNITRSGGDFQVIAEQDGVVYGGCHCGNWVYHDTYTWSRTSIAPGWTQADNIRFVGAWDAVTGAYLPEYVPGLRAARGHGPWELFTDSTGTMWMGGDYDRSETTGGRWQWAGGFVRYGQRDSTAPTAPTGITGGDASGTTTLSWGASSDDRGGVTYEVLRDDRVVAATWARQLSLPTTAGTARYFVRAVDGEGNRSATTAAHPVTAGTSPPPDEEPPPDEPPPPVEEPPADGVLASWSGTGDSFNVAIGTPPIVETGGSSGERMAWTQQPNEAAAVAWTGNRLGEVQPDNTLRWVATFSGLPSSSFVLAQGGTGDTGAMTAQRWRIDVAGTDAGARAGQLRLRDGNNTQTVTSGLDVLPLDTEVRIEAVRSGTTMSVLVFAPASSTTPLFSVTGAVHGDVNHVRLGHPMRNPTVPRFTADEIVLTDRAELVGPP